MKKIAIINVFVLTLSAFLLVGCNSGQYKNAKELMNAGSYVEAAEQFSAIPEYEDSAELYKQCMYNHGKELIDAGSLLEAADVFATILDFQNSKELYSSCLYSQGQQNMRNNSFVDAKECFDKIVDYKDAADLSSECDHLIDVQNDKTAPEIIGLAQGEILEAKFKEDFNLNDYLQKYVTVTDDVSGEITDYKIETDSTIYNKDSGDIDTQTDGSYDFSIVAKDEAENKTTVDFSIHIDALLHITADSEFPVVLYDGELGKYSLESIKYYGSILDAPDYAKGYYFTDDAYNDTDKDVDTYFARGYINDYRLPVYHRSKLLVTPGKKGVQFSYISEDNLDEHTKDFEQIEIEFVVAHEKEGSEDDEEIFVRPLLIDKDVIAFD